VLALDGWLEFNRVRWGLSPTRLRLSEHDGSRPAVEMVVYTDNRGRIRMPSLNPYLPVTFIPTDSESLPRLTRQWLTVSELAVAEFRQRGVVNSISFPPCISDVRPWQWSDYHVGVRYSFYLDLPYCLDSAESQIRTKIRKAERMGYRCERTLRMDTVLECIDDTAQRQQFEYGLSRTDLECCLQFLGTEVLRAYVCYAPNGDAASAQVMLSSPGTSAVGWLAGTKRDHLASGCSQLLIAFALEDLATAGASGFDHAGANIPSVATAKAAWGSRLVPYYTIREPNMRGLARYMLDFWRFGQKR